MGLNTQGKGAEVGLIFCERFVNLPEELVPPLHKALKEDIEWSCTTLECPKEERPFYLFTHLIGVSKCYLSLGRAVEAGIVVEGKEAPFFQLDEMEAYLKKSSWHFTFPVRPSPDPVATGKRKKKGGGLPGPDGRVVFLLTRKALDQ